MRDLKLFILSNCPYCQSALKEIELLRSEHPELAEVKIHLIEEREEKALASRYDYYLVPSFYVDDIKVHEGVVNKDQIHEIMSSVL